MSTIPTELTSNTKTFIRLSERSKAPLAGEGSLNGPFFYRESSELQRHIQNGGNVGRVLKDDVVALDIDDGDLLDHIGHLPETFVVESGGSGFSYHYYYRCSDYDQNQTELTTGGKNLGSIRSGSAYCLSPPSVHPDSDNRYRVYQNQELAVIDKSYLTDLTYQFDTTANTGNAAAGAEAAGVGSFNGYSEPIPENYPSLEVDLDRTKSWLSANDFLDDLNRTRCQDWSGLEFKLAKCLAEGGFSFESISNTLDRLNHHSKWHSKGESYRKLTVQKAIESAVNDEFVDFSTGDMDSLNESESRKTDSRSKDSRNTGGENMSLDYNQREQFNVYNGDSDEVEDGDRVIRVTVTDMSGRNDEGEEVDSSFVSVLKGQFQDDGEFGVSPQFQNEYDSQKSVGSANAEDLRLIAEGLEQVADSIED